MKLTTNAARRLSSGLPLRIGDYYYDGTHRSGEVNSRLHWTPRTGRNAWLVVFEWRAFCLPPHGQPVSHRVPVMSGAIANRRWTKVWGVTVTNESATVEVTCGIRDVAGQVNFLDKNKNREVAVLVCRGG